MLRILSLTGHSSCAESITANRIIIHTVQGILERSSNLGQKSDILRLEVLYQATSTARLSLILRPLLQYGGLYVDTDFECLKSFESVLARIRFFGALSNVGHFEVG